MSKQTQDFMDSLNASLKDTGRELSVSTEEVRAEAANQLQKLAMAAGEPGYDRAVIAARDNVALVAGLKSVSNADHVDNRIIGVIQGALFVGAKALAGGAA